MMREHPKKLFFGRWWAMAKARGEGAPPCSFESRILMVACRRGFFRAAEVGLFGCYCRRLAARCTESWGARRRNRETPAEKRLEEVVEGGEEKA